MIWIFFLLGEGVVLFLSSSSTDCEEKGPAGHPERLQFFIVISFAVIAGTTDPLHLANSNLSGPRLAADNIGFITEPLNCLQVFVS